MERYSRQRELILSSLKKRCDHPTAEKLYLDLKDEMPDLGIATVYRNLSALYESGDIAKIKLSAGPDRYEGNNEPHIHFICNNCDEIIDLEITDTLSKDIDENILNRLKNIGAEVEYCNISTSGTCKNCR